MYLVNLLKCANGKLSILLIIRFLIKISKIFNFFSTLHRKKKLFKWNR